MEVGAGAQKDFSRDLLRAKGLVHELSSLQWVIKEGFTVL